MWLEFFFSADETANLSLRDRLTRETEQYLNRQLRHPYFLSRLGLLRRDASVARQRRRNLARLR